MARENDINFGEVFCEAVDTIVSNKISNLNYNITKTCIIVDDTYGKIGKYIVQENATKYTAYSTDTSLKNNDSVLVLIPNGDYSMQKIITSKIVLENDLTTSVMYSSPLNNMINFTGDIVNKDNIIPEGDNINQKYFSLLANESGRTPTSKLIYSIDWSKYSGYERIGIAADFQTWLSELYTTKGEYGLEFLFFTNDATILDREQKNAVYKFVLNTNDMLGNPYNFETYFTQEKVIDISYLENIKNLDIYFYQNGDFKNEDGEYIPNAYENNEEFGESLEEQKFTNNLFVGNLKIFLGYPVGSFREDEVKISSTNLFYSALDSNEELMKNISLHWIHKIDEETFELIDETKENIEVYFVRYEQGAVDATVFDILGNGWTVQNFRQTGKFNCVLELNDILKTRPDINVKAVCRILREDGNWAKYESNILTFESTDIRIDENTRDAVLGLSIQCDDGSEGNYFIYDQNSEIINEGKGQGYRRILKLAFNGNEITKKATQGLQIESITWHMPQNTTGRNSYTMLIYEDSYLSSNTNAIDRNSNIVDVVKDLDGDYTQSYSISNTWYSINSHNTVACTIKTKEGNIYEASRELTFGKANSQGSNISIVLKYKNNKNAYEIKTDNANNILESPASIEIEGLIYDLSGNQIKLNDNTTKWEWSIVNNNEGYFYLSQNNYSNIAQLTFRVPQDNKLPDKIYSILKVVVNKVEAYLPIAIKTLTSDGTSRCETMEGARKVIYSSQGTPSYYTDAYGLFTSNIALNNIIWKINYKNDINGYPVLKELIKDNKSYQALEAKPLFIKDKQYECCAVATSANTIYWIQPILIMQSSYDFAIVNNWDGTQVIDQDGSKILTSSIAVGKVDNNNSFSGIIMGEIEENNVKNNGLYGISNGIITYALKDSGNVSFKSATNNEMVQILFGPGVNLLQGSSDLDQKLNLLDLNLDESFLSFQKNTSENSGLLLSAASENGYYLQLKNSNGKDVLSFKPENDNYIIQSSNYANDSTKGLQINLNNGIIIGNNAVSFTNGNNYIGTQAQSGNLLKLGKLRVDENGEVYYGSSTLTAYIKSLIPSVSG